MRANSLLYRTRRLFRLRYLRIDGFKLVGYRKGIPKHVSSLVARGDYEAPERFALKSFLRPSDKVIDIGSCIGLTALTAARVVGADNVVAFEPNPAAAAIARENFQLNACAITLHEAAVGATSGTMELSIGSDSWLGASGIARHQGAMCEVQMKDVAELVQTVRPTVLLIDAEGMERTIVPAIPFQTLRAVMIEVHPGIIGDATVADLVRHIADQGLPRRHDIGDGNVRVFERPQ